MTALRSTLSITNRNNTFAFKPFNYDLLMYSHLLFKNKILI